jgi:hypothetical protein
VSLEVKTRGMSRAEREEALAASLAFTRQHLAEPAQSPTR